MTYHRYPRFPAAFLEYKASIRNSWTRIYYLIKRFQQPGKLEICLPLQLKNIKPNDKAFTGALYFKYR